MKKKAFIFDLDGTLFETTAQEIETATGHARYIEFNDAEMLLKESTPRSLVDLAREVQAEGHSVYILELCESYGINPKYIFTVGDRGFDIPSYKAEILSQLALQYQSTYFFDDDEANLEMAPTNIRTIKA